MIVSRPCLSAGMFFLLSALEPKAEKGYNIFIATTCGWRRKI